MARGVGARRLIVAQDVELTISVCGRSPTDKRPRSEFVDDPVYCRRSVPSFVPGLQQPRSWGSLHHLAFLAEIQLKLSSGLRISKGIS